MKYKIDHDFHIHSKLSLCSGHEEQTASNILSIAKSLGLSKIIMTDHYWDSAVAGATIDFYKIQDYKHISQILPLPKSNAVDFLFGCETDMDRLGTIGIPKERYDDFSFIIVPTTHLHMTGFTITDAKPISNADRARLLVERLDAVLASQLPFKKVGIAHPACALINSKSRGDYLEVLDLVPDGEFERIYTKAASLGCGIELNQSDMSYSISEADTVLRQFKIAKSCGCKFYLGSDAHTPEAYQTFNEVFSRAVSDLELTEHDKFDIS